MSIDKFIKDPAQIKRVITSILYTTGSAMTIYNLFAFRGDKFGFYYRDDAQLWLAIGVSSIVLGWLIKNWGKL